MKSLLLFAQSSDMSSGEAYIWLVYIGFWLVSFIFSVWMLIDALQRDIENKYIWAILIFLGSPIGAFVYYFAERKKHVGKK